MKLKCPGCGYDGSTVPIENDEPFLYLEDIVCYRKVILNAEKELTVDGLYQTGEGFDDGENARLLCGNCLEEFPLPEGVEISWE